MKKNLLQFFGGLLIVYIVLCGMIVFSQRSMIYFPQPAMPENLGKVILPNGYPIQLQTLDGINLTSYLSPPKYPDRPILIVFHGNGALALHLVEQFQKVMDDGYGVLFAEYRGYGGNDGKPTEDGLSKDAIAHLKFIKEKYPNTKIILYGQSLGSAVAIDLAYRHPEKLAALILEVPFDSVLNVADKSYPFIPFKNILLLDKYHSDKKIGKIFIPSLFLLARQDEIVGFDGGQRLFELANEPKKIYIFDKARHMDIYNFGAEKVVFDFIEDVNQSAE